MGGAVAKGIPASAQAAFDNATDDEKQDRLSWQQQRMEVTDSGAVVNFKFKVSPADFVVRKENMFAPPNAKNENKFYFTQLELYFQRRSARVNLEPPDIIFDSGNTVVCSLLKYAFAYATVELYQEPEPDGHGGFLVFKVRGL